MQPFRLSCTRSAWASFALVLMFCLPLRAQEFPLFGALKPGPHAVGFKTELTFDYSRTFNTPKYNYEGEFQKGERARDMAIAVWFPAAKPNKPAYMRFEEYFFPPTGEISEQQKAAARQGLQNSPMGQNVAPEKFGQILNTLTAVVKNATPQTGAFPMLVLAQGFGLPANSHAAMCEYLASHGYIVASCPSRGAAGNQMTFDLVGVETQARDLEFIIGFLRNFPNVDKDKLGVMGFSFGGLPAATLAMRNTEVDACLSLDSAIGNNGGYALLFRSPFFKPAAVRAAFMHMTPMAVDATAPNAPVADRNFYRALKFSGKYWLALQGQRHFDFTTIGAVASIAPEYASFAGPKQGNTMLGHETVCRYALHFFNAHVKREQTALSFLQKSPEENGLPSGFATIESQTGKKAPPTENEIANIITTGGFEEVAELYRKMQKEDPEVVLFEENMMNILGYQLLQSQRLEDALDVFRLNIEA
ncbi:MAG: dienelactone hydrolase family protein, partial [candidate division KSB1 bacterium]